MFRSFHYEAEQQRDGPSILMHHGEQVLPHQSTKYWNMFFSLVFHDDLIFKNITPIISKPHLHTTAESNKSLFKISTYLEVHLSRSSKINIQTSIQNSMRANTSRCCQAFSAQSKRCQCVKHHQDHRCRVLEMEKGK